MKNISKTSIVNALAISFIFSLAGTSVAFAAGPASVNLGSAGNFTILAKTGISTTGTTSVVGDIGVSPAAATAITGFGLVLPVASAFSTSALVTGKVYAPDYADPTPANMTTAISDMQTAYTDAQGRTNPTATELGAGNIGGMTLTPGLYKWGTGVTIPTDVTLSGSANDVWIFQIAQNLDLSSGVKVVLSGGAQAGNIFWAVAGQTTLGTTSVLNGNILDQTAIVLNTGATLYGRALAQTAVTLDASSVTKPSASAAVVTTPVPTVVVVTTPVAQTVTSVAAVAPTSSPAATLTATKAYDDTSDSGCLSGNKFSTVTGRNCGSITVRINEVTETDAGCLPGNKFSIVTGKNCESHSGISANVSTNFGQQVRAIAKNLWKGVKDNNVKTLQEFLISQNKGPAAQALAKITATTYFGEMTRAALAEFQAAVGISPASGSFGPKTRAYVDLH